MNLTLCGAGSTLEIVDSSITEGDIGTSEMVFVVNHSIRSKSSTDIYYTTINGSAKAGKDYIATNGTVVMAPNENTTRITVPIINDTKYTADKKTFSVSIASETTVAKAVGMGTIIENDPKTNKITAAKGGRNENAQ